jgi:OOP family OmpA-OmpF porin
VPPEVEKFSGTIDGISFKTGAATIAPRSNKVLREALGVLKKYKEVRLEIQGHTDNSGDREANLSLSQKRAEAVRQWLVSKGIDGDRLTARGYGPDKPVADNSTKAGQAKNRRVEFVRISGRPQ